MSEAAKAKVLKEAVDWYAGQQNLYRQLSQKVENIIKELIELENIPYHVVLSRVKEVKSFSNKISKKEYKKPQVEITDLAGVRIITYVESQIEPICKIVESNFEIDHQNSHDKSEELGIDKVGYKSVHYVAKLSNHRIRLPEYKRFKDTCFEIQIRTILQHAWAEIEHDRNYKFSGILPKDIQRRFRLLAGTLESADREFNSISNEIDKISKEVEIATKTGDLNIPINSTSIKQYLTTKFGSLERHGFQDRFSNKEIELQALLDLSRFGITTLQQLDNIIPRDFIENQIKTKTANENTFSGILVDIMIIHDYRKYFETVWSVRHWRHLERSSHKLYQLYNVPIGEILLKHDIHLVD